MKFYSPIWVAEMRIKFIFANMFICTLYACNSIVKPKKSNLQWEWIKTINIRQYVAKKMNNSLMSYDALKFPNGIAKSLQATRRHSLLFLSLTN